MDFVVFAFDWRIGKLCYLYIESAYFQSIESLIIACTNIHTRLALQTFYDILFSETLTELVSCERKFDSTPSKLRWNAYADGHPNGEPTMHFLKELTLSTI
jgi:hypothetical protein